MITELKEDSKMKFDSSEVDPDHVAWLEEEASIEGMSVDELLSAEATDKISLEPRFEEQDYDDEDLLKSVTIKALEISDARLRMALKRLADQNGTNPQEEAARILAFGIIFAEASHNYKVDILTGLIVEG